MKKKTRLPVLIWVALGLAGTTGAVEAEGNDGKPGKTQSPVAVTARPLASLLFFPRRDAPARTVSFNDTRVSAEIRGILEAMPVKVGENVKKGDLLGAIVCKDYQIAERQAQAEYKAGVAKHDYNKSQLASAKKLLTNRNISSDEFDRRSSEAATSGADLDRLSAVLAAAHSAVEKCNIHAPFDAVVIEVPTSLGDYLQPGSPVVRLLDRTNLEVSAKVQEQDLESLIDAADIRFVARASEYPLELRAALPLVQSRIRSYEVRLVFTDKQAPPGSVGRVEWRMKQAHIAADILVRRGNLGVFIESGGVAEFKVLDNARDGRPATINLPPETRVIMDGRFRLSDGDHVQIVEQ